MGEPKKQLISKALTLEYITIGWNVFEAIVAISAGVAASSMALISFGLDSCIEITAAIAILYRFGNKNPDKQDAAEKKALRIVGVTFVILAIYVSIESVRRLWSKNEPEASVIGIALTTISAVSMPFLAAAKKRIAKELNSRALLADSKETLFCALLSIVVLIGLAANALFGWWWADPTASLVISLFLFKEAKESFEK